MNLHLKTGLGNKNYVLDPNSDVENEFFLTDFLWQFWAKNTKINFSSESVKTKEHKESNSCDKYHFSINAFYKINLRPILKKLLQKIDVRHFPLFEIFAHLQFLRCFFCNSSFWATILLKQGSTSEGRDLALKTPYSLLPYIFWTVSTFPLTWYHPIYAISIQTIE